MIYLSGAHNFGCEKDFERAYKKAEKIDDLVIDPVAKMMGKMSNVSNYEELMAIRLSFIDMCSSIYMIKNWQSSTGANRELGYALGQGKQVYFEE